MTIVLFLFLKAEKRIYFMDTEYPRAERRDLTFGKLTGTKASGSLSHSKDTVSHVSPFFSACLFFPFYRSSSLSL